MSIDSTSTPSYLVAARHSSPAPAAAPPCDQRSNWRGRDSVDVRARLVAQLARRTAPTRQVRFRSRPGIPACVPIFPESRTKEAFLDIAKPTLCEILRRAFRSASKVESQKSCVHPMVSHTTRARPVLRWSPLLSRQNEREENSYK